MNLEQRLENCDLCPRECGVNRLKNEKGYCGGGRDPRVYTAFLHQGEEPPISSERGSGTIFFSGCSLRCVYCQNYKFSHFSKGKVLNENDLAKLALKLQNQGAHNINLVTPTHFLPQILKSLELASSLGLKIPIVYNTSGYEKEEIISLLEGHVDIYLADFKYIRPETAAKYSQAPDYPKVCTGSIKEMCRQKKELIIRHLVLPGYIDESKEILTWIKEQAPEAKLSLMFQYQPYFKAKEFPEINRRVSVSEYRQIKDFLGSLDLGGWQQELNCQEDLAGKYFQP
jgi:putative pyruvate formate lyase activating enzyme